jgi:hypothetical protein
MKEFIIQFDESPLKQRRVVTSATKALAPAKTLLAKQLVNAAFIFDRLIRPTELERQDKST